MAENHSSKPFAPRADLPRIRVLIADDNYAFRQGLNILLGFEPDMEVVALASNDRQTIQLAQTHKPHAIVMDLSMGEISGTEIIRQLAQELPDTKILVLSGHSEKKLIDAALRSGAFGYILKSSSLHEVPIALRKVCRDQVPIGVRAHNAHDPGAL